MGKFQYLCKLVLVRRVKRSYSNGVTFEKKRNKKPIKPHDPGMNPLSGTVSIPRTWSVRIQPRWCRITTTVPVRYGSNRSLQIIMGVSILIRSYICLSVYCTHSSYWVRSSTVARTHISQLGYTGNVFVPCLFIHINRPRSSFPTPWDLTSQGEPCL